MTAAIASACPDARSAVW